MVCGCIREPFLNVPSQYRVISARVTEAAVAAVQVIFVLWLDGRHLSSILSCPFFCRAHLLHLFTY
jgi:hypothetical protein